MNEARVSGIGRPMSRSPNQSTSHWGTMRLHVFVSSLNTATLLQSSAANAITPRAVHCGYDEEAYEARCYTSAARHGVELALGAPGRARTGHVYNQRLCPPKID